jgi:peroxiredoxin
MANLTGEYDVAIEAPVATINRVLAAIHENQDTRFPILPHSFRTFVDDTSRGAGDPVLPDERTGVQGIAEVQVSAPTISLPQGGLVVSDGFALARIRTPRGPWGPGEPSDISIRAGVRVWMQGSSQVPEYIHGDLIVNADVVRTDLGLGPVVTMARLAPGLGGFGPILGGGTYIGLDKDSMTVAFVPAAGTTVSSEERSRISRIARNVLRADFDPVTWQITVPPGVRSWAHRFDRQHASMLLLMSLTPAAGISPGAAGQVPGGLVPAGADFAVTIGRNFVLPKFKEALLRGIPGEFSFSRGWGTVSAKVRPNLGAATVELEAGQIVARIPGSGSIRYVGGLGGVTTDDFTFTVRLAFTLVPSGTSLEVRPLGNPQVDLSGVAVFEGWIEDQAESKIREERDRALERSQGQIRQELEIAGRLKDVLAGLHPSDPGVSLLGAQIRADGIVVGARIGLAPSKPVVVRQVRRQGKIDALDSWIPGGTIDRFVWYADRPVVQPLRFMAAGGPGEHVEEHRFVREEGQLEPVHAFQMRCLEVHGRRLTPIGAMGLISGHTCGFYIPVFPWPTVGWPGKVGRPMPAVSLEGVRPDGSEGTVAHFNPWASGLAPAEGGTALVVHLADEGASDVEALVKTVAGVKKGAVAAVILLPSGGRLRAEVPETRAGFVVGEDPEGHWSEALGVSGPATVALDPKGNVAYKEEGRLSASKLARALSGFAEDDARVTWQPLRLGLAAGDPVPEVPFRIGRGAELSMHRMRGRRVALSFWASWCEPSLEQLRQFARAYEAAEGQGPLVLAVGDGESPDRAEELAKAEGFPFALIPDPDRTISTRFGVGVWPSTIWIGPDQRVEAVSLGLTSVGGDGEDRHKGMAQAY